MGEADGRSAGQVAGDMAALLDKYGERLPPEIVSACRAAIEGWTGTPTVSDDELRRHEAALRQEIADLDGRA